ncbi:hypothetical protein C0995_000784 [Termitomyces sp. Mi166|nr:hypothetical protein C0995_000784 [Termitomyces sp. Mi166\
MVDFTIAEVLSIIADVIYLKYRSLPDAPTGYYDWQITTDPSDVREGHSRVTSLIDKGAFLNAVMNPMTAGDRKGALNYGLGILARLDPNSNLGKKMNNRLINVLYNTVPHPPASYLGLQSSFRHADGGGNNFQDPNLGRAGMPYARSVQGKAGLPRTSLPDPGLVFDTILKRHKIRSLYSREFKLDQAAQDKVRDKASGRGLLFRDTFSDERFSFLPPATSVLLVLFSRNHNYIAKKILKINERRRWYEPPPNDPVKFALQDEEIFQTARLINCGHFLSAIMGDYVAGFLGMSEGWDWSMNAFDTIQTSDTKVDRGLGNHVSVEFNILYRWHTTLSEKDLKWTEDVFRGILGDRPFEELSLKDLGVVAHLFDNIASNPAERTFAGLERGPDGTFFDDDLAEILYSATECPAGAFRGRGTPAVLRLAEVMGIEQSRAWGVCTMNEFRKFLGLPEFKTFEEWNPDPEIAKQSTARRLYGHIDNLELYTGLQAESTLPLADVSRFACGYTTTRAILGDAIALVRGDRFYTSDFTPANLTTWGFYDCQRDMNNGGLGGQIPKLLLRHMPRHFPWNSVYSLYPFFTPQKMRESLTRRKIDKKYTFERPQTLPVTKILTTFAGIKTVLSDPSRFNIIYEHSYGSPLLFDEAKMHDADKAMVIHALFPNKESLDRHASTTAASVMTQIKQKSWKYPNISGNYVDIVKGVINAVAASVAADKMTGIPLKTKQNPSGIFTENEFFDMLVELNFLGAVIARVSSFLWPPTKKPCYPFLSALTATSRPIDDLIGNIIGVAVNVTVNFAHAVANVIDFYLDDSHAEEKKTIVKLIANKDPQSGALLFGYVREAMRKILLDLYTCISLTSSPGLQPQYSGVWRGVVKDAVIDQGPGYPSVEVKAGDRIWASLRNAHLNPVEFPEPTKVNPTRPVASYNLNGTGFHCPSETYALKTVVEIVKVVFSLKNVRRAPGDAGRLHRFTEVLHETEVDFFIQRNGTVSLMPGSMYIVYDD